MTTLTRPSSRLTPANLQDRGADPHPGEEVLHFLGLAAAAGWLPGDVDLPQQYLASPLQARVPQRQQGP